MRSLAAATAIFGSITNGSASSSGRMTGGSSPEAWCREPPGRAALKSHAARLYLVGSGVRFCFGVENHGSGSHSGLSYSACPPTGALSLLRDSAAGLAAGVRKPPRRAVCVLELGLQISLLVLRLSWQRSSGPRLAGLTL